MPAFRRLTEGLARKTSRRSFFDRGMGLAFGALAGAAAGAAARPSGTEAGFSTVCSFPGPPCPCDNCQSSGVCAKPCVILTQYYSGGCWVNGTVTCCDCTCPGIAFDGWCGCGSDYHNNPTYCPNGNATGA